MSIIFKNAIEAQEYAKKNIGVAVTRNHDGEGYIIKEKYYRDNSSTKKITSFKNDKKIINSSIVTDISLSVANTLVEKNELITSDTTSEFIEKDELIIDDTISSEVAGELLVESLSPISKTGIGLVGIGLLFGLPF